MTRDEAIELAHEKWVTPNTKSSECIVDILCALGILKLDEPKTFNQKLCDGMKASLGVWLNAGEIERVQESFDAAGLRIVEK